MGKSLNLVGQKFNKLLVVAEAAPIIEGHKHWKCLCDCGNTKITYSKALRSNNVKSCGCLKEAQNEKFKTINMKHKMSKTRFYDIWAGILRRTTHGQKGYEGVPVSDEWRSFNNFYTDMFPTYEDTLSIDRICNEEGYCKENCRWVIREDQNRNKRMYSSNATGHANIFFSTSKGKPYLMCKVTYRGKAYTKRLSMNCYTFDEAVSILKEWRDLKHKELGFHENHANEKQTQKGIHEDC